MRRFVDTLILFALVLGLGYVYYYHHDVVQAVAGQLEAKFAPCRSPITYSVGSIDPHFGISKSIVVADLKEAENIWESGAHKDLFTYEPAGGAVTVNFVYDYRQKAADKLAASGIQIEKSESSYESLKAQYDALAARVAAEKTQLEKDYAAYKAREAAYNNEVDMWNTRGGAPPAQYAQLQGEKAALDAEAGAVQAEQAKDNNDIDTLNALATTLNQLIATLNLHVDMYNKVGASQGEFNEGIYESEAGRETITIYEYTSRAELVRVLAHELGHALGLRHVQDPNAIMYEVNKGEGLKLAPDDIAALDKLCASGVF